MLSLDGPASCSSCSLQSPAPRCKVLGHRRVHWPRRRRRCSWRRQPDAAQKKQDEEEQQQRKGRALDDDDDDGSARRFSNCPAAAAELLKRRWAILVQEQRFGQLLWEAGKILVREPGFPAAIWARLQASKSLRLIEPLRELLEVAEGYPELILEIRSTIEASLRSNAASSSSSSSSSSQPLNLDRPPIAVSGAASRPRVVVASAFCGVDFAAKMLPARRNHERYCSLHGYGYSCLEENSSGRTDPTWSKLPHVVSLLRQGSDFVFWMDADSLFINDGSDLSWACDLGRELVFAGDLNVVFNAGHFLARRGAWVEGFLEDAYRIFPWPEWEDNGALMIKLGGGHSRLPESWRPAFERMKVATRSEAECHYAMEKLIAPEVAQHVQVVPQHRMNSYEWPGGGGLQALARGDPILHFAGCSSTEKVDLVSRFAPADGDPGILCRLRPP